MQRLMLGTMLLAIAGFTLAGSAEPKPNFVFVIADDCTHRDIGCYGGQAHTPNIDKLAIQGIRMTRCFQAAPMCSPTRHNLYTGLYPVKSGAYPNHTFVKDGVKSVVHYLKPLGYRVALSGKQHIGPRSAFPFEYSGKKNPDMTVIDSLFGECRKSESPFCVFLCSNEPHSPWDKGDPSRYPPDQIKLPPYYVDDPQLRNQLSRYLAEITYFDDQVGQVLRLLDQHQLAEDTVVMVVSEQGNSFPFAKWTVYDSGLQSAMVVRWPGRIQAGSTSDAMVEYVDVLPTFLNIAGAAIPSELDGQSMLNVLTGKTTVHKEFVFGIQSSRGILAGPDHYGRRSVRSTTHKLIHNLDPKAMFYNLIAKEKYFKGWQAKAAGGDLKAQELVNRYFSPPEFELFDVVKDPLELHNLASDPQYAELMKGLRKELAGWMNEQGDLGQATEMKSLERMTGGNRSAKNAAKARKASQKKNQGKRRKKKKE